MSRPTCDAPTCANPATASLEDERGLVLLCAVHATAESVVTA